MMRSNRAEAATRRIAPALLWCATIALGLSVRAALNSAPAKHLGVAFWATSVYFLIVTISPRLRPALALLLCLFISWGVELAQLTDNPRRLSALHPLLRLVFGEVFHPIDLASLAAGAMLGWLIWTRLGRISGAQPSERNV